MTYNPLLFLLKEFVEQSIVISYPVVNLSTPSVIIHWHLFKTNIIRRPRIKKIRNKKITNLFHRINQLVLVEVPPYIENR